MRGGQDWKLDGGMWKMLMNAIDLMKKRMKEVVARSRAAEQYQKRNKKDSRRARND